MRVAATPGHPGPAQAGAGGVQQDVEPVAGDRQRRLADARLRRSCSRPRRSAGPRARRGTPAPRSAARGCAPARRRGRAGSAVDSPKLPPRDRTLCERAPGMDRLHRIAVELPPQAPRPWRSAASRTSRRSARARSRQVRMPQGDSRAARRPAIPVISVTGRSASSCSSASAVEHRQRPERLGRVGDQLGQRPRPGDPHRHRHADPLPDPVADRHRQILRTSAPAPAPPGRRTRRSSNTRPAATSSRTHVQHQPAEDLVPAEIALDVDPSRALDQRLPDRLAGLRPPPPSSRSSWRSRTPPGCPARPPACRARTRPAPAPPTRKNNRRRDGPPPLFLSTWTEM